MSDPLSPEALAPEPAPKRKRTRKPKATATRYESGKPTRSYEYGKKPTFTAPFNVVVPNTWTNNDGEICTSWTTVGAAWPTESGKGWTIKLRGGISVSGSVYLFPNDRESKEQF